ncbi:MAG: type III pantothenate kinase [Spirochaetaceae bacterium]|nr:MAG: type III pantothenate kinase [Spirochaetaceae bacterium]
MLLAIDIGNTNIVIGVFRDAAVECHFRLQSVHDRMADEYRLIMSGLLREAGVDPGRIASVVISSVVPALTESLAAAAMQLAEVPVLVVRPGIRLNITIDIGNPAELGSDLVANAAAAYARLGSGCIVVDFGTALTFTAVSSDARILGAAIAPGLNTAVYALSTGTAQLPEIDLGEPQTAIGTDTAGALRAGIVLGYEGLVTHVVTHMKREMGGKVHVIATGGLSERMARRLTVIDSVDPWLTLDGLRVIAELNQDSR